MNLEELKSAGALVSAEPVEKKITWTKVGEDGTEKVHTFKVFIKRRSFGTVEKMFSGDSDRSRSAAMIAETVLLGKDGKECFSYDDAYQLEPSLAFAFVAAINEVNKVGEAPPKN